MPSELNHERAALALLHLAHEGVRLDCQQEGARARAWREGMKLSRRELAELTGYAERTIAAFEAGEYGPGRPIDPKAMQTYRLVCAAVALGIEFDWKVARMRLGPAMVAMPIASIGEIDDVGSPA